MRYGELLEDIASVCQTLQEFIRMGISSLDKLTPDNYLAALHEFLYSERSYKWIANPLEGTGFYTAIDDVRLQLVPRETSPGSGTFKVYEYYETMHLQTMLKLDFYKALEAGHIIRKCENCGRYFCCRRGTTLSTAICLIQPIQSTPAPSWVIVSAGSKRMRKEVRWRRPFTVVIRGSTRIVPAA